MREYSSTKLYSKSCCNPRGVTGIGRETYFLVVDTITHFTAMVCNPRGVTGKGRETIVELVSQSR